MVKYSCVSWEDFSFSEISSFYDMSVSVHTYMETLYLGE